MRRIAAVGLLLVLLAPVAPSDAHATEGVVVEDFHVAVATPFNSLQGMWMRGEIYRPADRLACDASVMFLLHGQSFRSYAWDLDVEPEHGIPADNYSTARTLAAAGYPVVTVDRWGYRPPFPNGYEASVPAHAQMVAQIVGRLRNGDYKIGSGPGHGGPKFERVGLMGHSVGAEIAQFAAGMPRAGSAPLADVLVAGGYTYFPDPAFQNRMLTDEVPRALQRDYSYFGRTPQERAQLLFHVVGSQGDVVEADMQRAREAPSGEILSLAAQPSRAVIGNIDVPVYLILGQFDALYPTSGGEAQLAQFSSAPVKRFDIANVAGHAYMLHKSASDTNRRLINWLRNQAKIPAC